MRTTDIERELERERKALSEKVDAIDQALAGIQAYKGAKPTGNAKLNSDKPKVEKPKAKKPTQPKVECPDCGEKYHKGPGMAAHRKQVHGWRKGQPLDKPVPRARFE